MRASGTPARVSLLSSSPAVAEPSYSVLENDDIASPSISLTLIPGQQHEITNGPLSNKDGVDPRFVLPKCILPPRAEFQPVELFVAKAIREQHEQKDDLVPLKNYKGLIEAIRFKADPNLLRMLLLALRTNHETVHLLTKSSTKHARLIHLIVKLNPFEGHPNPSGGSIPVSVDPDYSLADAHLHLIVVLVSANSVFLVPAMTALWKHLTFQLDGLPEEIVRRIHAALATIFRLCPKGKAELYSMMASNAPYRTRPGPELIWYYEQCLHTLRYLASIHGDVMELLVEKCLDIDVDIKINDGGDVCIDDNEDKHENVFELDLDTQDEGIKIDNAPAVVTVDEMAEKLDALMVLVFQHVENSLRENGDCAPFFYQVLCRVFESSVLTTHKSKFVQFLVLHICGLELTSRTGKVGREPLILYRCFAARLIDIIFDPFRATVVRQSGACYLASFVSRASFVCPETACESVCALLSWAEVYIQSTEPLSIQASDERSQCNLHSLFYTICQSAFYIMCFRGSDAVMFYRTSTKSTDSQPERVDLGSQRWTRLCSHPLNPLRYCLESVRTEFLHVAKAFELVNPRLLDQLFAEGINSTAKREKVVSRIITPATLEKERQTGGVGGLGRGMNPLDSFFPFDPYLLCQSQVFVAPFYVHWGGSIQEDVVDMDEHVTVGSPTAIEENASLDDNESMDDDRKQGSEQGVEFQPVSFASDVTSLSSRGYLPAMDQLDDMAQHRTLKEGWNQAVVRSRAPSIENGSW